MTKDIQFDNENKKAKPFLSIFATRMPHTNANATHKRECHTQIVILWMQWLLTREWFFGERKRKCGTERFVTVR